MQRRILRSIAVVTAAAALLSTLAAGAAGAANAAEEVPAPAAVRQGDWILDPAARGVVTYEGTVNIASFQQEGLLTYNGYQYVAWFQSDKRVAISRRALPDGDWQSIELPAVLDIDDSHNVISLGVSPDDGRLHMVLGTHVAAVRYFQSVPGLLRSPEQVPWTATSFSSEFTGLPGAIGAPTTGTYPVFETTDAGDLYFTWREGVTSNGRNQLARYNAATGLWSFVGQYTSGAGTYATAWGTSNSRYAYLHGFIENPVTKELTATWSWRENAGAWCDRNGLGNHDLGYATSSDGGVTWRNNAGVVIGVAGTADQISIDDDHVVVPIAINRGLINQESMTFDAAGRTHVIASSFNDADLTSIGGCHRQTYPQREQYAKPFHHWREADGTWRSMELPFYNNSAGRSKLLFDAHDTAYLVLPDARIAAATAASGWADWKIVFEDAAVDNIAELIVDRHRLAVDSVLTVAYQETPVANAPSAFRVADFSLDPDAREVARSVTEEAAPVPYVPIAVTASASSSQPGFPAPRAVDGSPGTFWVSGGTTEGAGPQPASPETLTMEWTQARTFNAVTVTPRNSTSGVRAFAIEARTADGWTRLAEVTQGRAVATHAVPTTTTTALRLVITAAWDGDRAAERTRNVQVAEVSVSGPTRQDFEAPRTNVQAPAFSTGGDIRITWSSADPAPGSALTATELWVTESGASEALLAVSQVGPAASGSFGFEPEEDGTYALAVRSLDDAGNAGSLASPIKVVRDTVAPEVTASADRTARRLTLTATDATSGVERIEYRLTGGEWIVYEEPLTVGRAETVVEYRAADFAGNVGEPASVTVADGSTTKPAKAGISHDNGNDTGLRDGAYTVTVNLWWGENASAVELYENEVLIQRTPVAFASPAAQRASFPISGRVNGDYVYRAKLINFGGETWTDKVTVKVTDASPGVPVLSEDNWDGDGTYTVTANMWWGTNATSWRLWEDGVQIVSGNLVAATPQAQKVSLPLSGRPRGSHVYRIEFVNDLGVTSSRDLAVHVSR